MAAREGELTQGLTGTTPAQLRTIDVSQAGNSIQALRLVEEYLSTYIERGDTVDVRTGTLLLTRGILSKITMLFKKHALRPGTVYSSVPQTQQAALDEGFSVREKPVVLNPVSFDVARTGGVSYAGDGIDLPGFQGKPRGPQLPKVDAPYNSAADTTYVEKTSQRLLDILPPAPAQSKPLPPEIDDDMDTVFRQMTQQVMQKSYVIPTPQASPVDLPLIDDDLVRTFDHELAAEESPTLFLKQTLRSGQVVRFNGSVVVIGDAHAGSEIAASGDIVVWGELRGIAHAGVGGSVKAEIRAMKIDALQLRIGDFIARRPDRIAYHKPSASSLAPEVAKVYEGEIRIFREEV